MRFIGIDPGMAESGFAVWHDGKLPSYGIRPNIELLESLARLSRVDVEGTLVAIEMVAMASFAGASLFETCTWIGKFELAWSPPWQPRPFRRVFRKTVVAELCGSVKAGDSEVRKALVELIGPVGTKRAPGPLFGVKKHAWSALAVAVVAERLEDAERIAAAERREFVRRTAKVCGSYALGPKTNPCTLPSGHDGSCHAEGTAFYWSRPAAEAKV